MEHGKRNILVLSDGKAGHLKQSLAVSECIPESHTQIIEVAYKHFWSRYLLSLGIFLPFLERFYPLLLRWALKKKSYQALCKSAVILSTGSSLGHLNLLLSRLYEAKSVVIMTPPIGAQREYTLRIIPQHDHPTLYPNTLITLASPTSITPHSIVKHGVALKKFLGISTTSAISIFIGGNTPKQQMANTTLITFIEKIRAFCSAEQKSLLITTSRRTSSKIIFFLKKELSSFCKLLVISSEKDQAVDTSDHLIEGMMGLSDLIFVTNDSLSMISEAASSGKKVIVLQTLHRTTSPTKHEQMIKTLEQHKYIYCASPDTLKSIIQKARCESTPVLNEREIISSTLRAIL